MLACFLDAPRKVAVRDVLIPKLAAGDILVKVEASGICGTDLEKIEGQLGAGGILGHEVSGTIEKVADSITDYKPGERVVVHHHVPCYQCPDCSDGNYTLCSEFRRTNIDPCGFAEYFRVPQYNVARGAVIPLPAELSFEEGAMIEPTACCIRAIRRAHIQQSDNVLVVGLGPTGLTQIQLLRNTTTGRIIASDIIDARLRLGKKLGADETEREGAQPSLQFSTEGRQNTPVRSPLPRRLLSAQHERALLAPDHTPLKLLLRRGRDGGGDKTRQTEEYRLEESHLRPFQAPRR